MANWMLRDLPDDVLPFSDRAAAAGWVAKDLVYQLMRDYLNGRVQPTTGPPRAPVPGRAPRDESGT